MHLTSFTRSHTTDNVGAIFNHLSRVEGPFSAGKTLNDDSAVFSYQYTHKLVIDPYMLEMGVVMTFARSSRKDETKLVAK